MARSFRSSLASLALAVAVACIATATDTIYSTWRGATRMVVKAWRFACEMTFKALRSTVMPAPANLPGPQVVLLRAKQYLLRQVKRMRPVVFPSWNMSPST